MEDQERALKLATEAGHILLENGAEISRVEDTMQHIASMYGVLSPRIASSTHSTESKID